jgi:hypothetical protein
MEFRTLYSLVSVNASDLQIPVESSACFDEDRRASRSFDPIAQGTMLDIKTLTLDSILYDLESL